MSGEQQTQDKTVALGPEHDLTKFVAGWKGRYALNGIRYRVRLRCLEATDGKLLIRVPVRAKSELNKTRESDWRGPEEGPTEDVTLDAKGVAEAIRMRPKAGWPPVAWLVKAVEKGAAILTGRSPDARVTMHLKELEGRWPDTNAVFPGPTDPAPVLTIKLGAGLLEKLAGYAARHGRDGNLTTIEFRFRSPTVGVAFEFGLKNAHDARGLLMPIVKS